MPKFKHSDFSIFDKSEINPKFRKKIIDWTTYFRRNIHRFIEIYLGIDLYFYQIIWVYLMSMSNNFVAIASRAAAKSWLIAVYSFAIGILYPGSLIVVVASSMKQAGIIFDKLEQIRSEHPNIVREVYFISNSDNKRECKFHNGSNIKVVACGEGGRGNRATLVIGEEFRRMKKDMFDSIVLPFSQIRQVPYIKKKEYEHLKEDPRQILISSAWYKSEWWYGETIKTIKGMVQGKSFGFIALDYLISIKHNIKTALAIKNERDGMDSITAMLEYDNIPYGESTNSFYSLEMFTKNQNIKKAFYPQDDDNYDPKKNPYAIKKVPGELRVVSVDFATRKGKINDNSIISCTRLLPTKQGYQRYVVYMDAYNGMNTYVQALKMKRVFYDFEADYFVLDIKNAGRSLYDALSQDFKDEVRDEDYPGWKIMQHETITDSYYEEFSEIVISSNPESVIFPITASAALNDEIAKTFRDRLTLKRINFLIPDNEAEEFLIKTNDDYLKMGDSSDGMSERVKMLAPYVQTSALITECISLSKKILNGNIKLEEPSNGRKDRYTSVAYMNYFASFLDREITRTREKEKIDMNEFSQCSF